MSVTVFILKTRTIWHHDTHKTVSKCASGLLVCQRVFMTSGAIKKEYRALRYPANSWQANSNQCHYRKWIRHPLKLACDRCVYRKQWRLYRPCYSTNLHRNKAGHKQWHNIANSSIRAYHFMNCVALPWRSTSTIELQMEWQIISYTEPCHFWQSAHRDQESSEIM